MKMEVEILSKELVKPSSPTPNHLRHLHLSFLDQIVPHLAVPLVLYYSNKSNLNNLEICNQLKKSLSKVLTTFYPIAGRFNNNSYIDCNDEGVLFVEAKADCQLSDVLRVRNPSNNNYVVPGRLDEYGDLLVALIQTTFFSCGGIVVSVSLSHKLGDALSWFTFINSWAATTRENAQIFNIPPFGTATLFPPLDMSRFGTYTGELMKEELVTKLFVFDSIAIRALKDKYSAKSGRRISSVLAVGGFICSRFMVTSQKNKNKKYKVMQGVNLRTRANPPLPMSSFGNYAIAGQLVDGNVDDEDDDHWFEAVKRMADSTRNLKADHITNMLQNREEVSNFLNKISNDQEGVVSFVFSSVHGIPIYEIDFGWGKPLWAGTSPCHGNNIVFMFSTSDGLGLEAWVTLQEEDMAKFEMDNKLLQHVSLHTLKLDAHSRL